jgi:hypothetical protein
MSMAATALKSNNADRNWEDMTVASNDVAPAPVPQHATMLLLGTDLVGLAGVSRKKLNKK